MLAKTVISTVFAPGEAHLDSVRSRAIELLELGAITALPTVEKGISTMPGHGMIVINHPPEDGKVWFAFYKGVDTARNNRGLF